MFIYLFVLFKFVGGYVCMWVCCNLELFFCSFVLGAV